MQKKYGLKQFLAICPALVLCFSLLQAAALAAEGDVTHIGFTSDVHGNIRPH